MFTLKEMMMTGLCTALLTCEAGASNFTKGREIEPLPKELKPCDFVWIQEVSPTGPMVVIVSIPKPKDNILYHLIIPTFQFDVF